MDFIALDFETANRNPDSVCEIGLAVVEDGIIVENESWLIKPYDNIFEPYHTKLHGINEETVADAPEFWEVWTHLKRHFQYTFVVAHNASFDIKVLKNVLTLYRLPIPEFFYSCSLKISRKIWDGRKSYGLHALSEWLDIELDHHSAASDANACAEIVLRAAEEKEIYGFEQLVQEANLSMGHVIPGEDLRRSLPKKKSKWNKKRFLH